MKGLAIGLAAASAVILPSASLAATSGTVSASVTVGYSCDITVPSNQLLTVSGTSASASADLPYSQNGSTDYSLTSLSITSPTGSDVSGSITVTDASSSVLVTNTSESSSSTGTTNTGADTGTGSVAFAISEDTASVFIEGPYAISSTLSCSESAGGGL